MAGTLKVWQHEVVTPDTSVDIVSESAVIASIIVANPTSGDINFIITLGGLVIQPTWKVTAKQAITLDIRSLNVSSSVKLAVEADTADVVFTASGVSYE